MSKEIRQYIADIMPESLTANDEMINEVVEELPHLAAVSDEQSVRNEIPLYSSRERVRSTLVQEYAKKQLESLNYVKNKAREYEKKGPPNFDEFLKNEYINIFRDMKSSDFKNFLEKGILTYTKGSVEKNFEKVTLTSGWNIKPSTSKKKSLDLEHGI